jgi:hypothetical protein
MLAKSYPYLKFVEDGRRTIAECLFESDEFKARPVEQRVVSSTFRSSGKVGFFRLHADVSALCQWVERTPVPDRNSCIVLLENQPVRMYLDVEQDTAAEMGREEVECLLKDVGDVLQDAFASAYPSVAAAADGLAIDRWWYFSASHSKKVSFHIHADPDSPHPAWSSVVELAAFMKGHVKSMLEREWLAGTPRARRLKWKKGNQMEWFIDFSVYSRSRSMKLPLCCKPTKTTMALFQAPAGVQNISERKQLEVGMPQVWPHSPAVFTMLPNLSNHSPGAPRPAAAAVPRAGGSVSHQTHASAAATGAHSLVSNEARTRAAAIVMQQLQRVRVGPAAQWASFELDVVAQTCKGTLAKRSAICPFKEGVHSSNQLKVNIAKGQIRISCWAPACSHRWLTDSLSSAVLDALFSSSSNSSSTTTTRSSSSSNRPPTNDEDPPCPSSLEDDLELDKEIDIERDLFGLQPVSCHVSASPVEAESSSNVNEPDPLENDAELAKALTIEREIVQWQQMANFGMPLDMSRPGIRTMNERYLLPPSLKKPGAEARMKKLMLHRRLALRSPMDSAKSSAFILYILWLLCLFPKLRILLVSNRLTLTASLLQRLTKAGISCTSYLKSDTAELRRAQVAIVQLDSLWKLEGALPYDIVLMDESESTLFHFHADTLKRRSDVWQTLRSAIEQATQVILLDAKLGSRSQAFLEGLVPRGCSTPAFTALLRESNGGINLDMPSEVRIWVNQHRADNKVYHIHNSTASFHARMHQLLEQGKKVAIASNNCQKAKELHREMLTKHPHLHDRVLLITRESDDAVKFADCNTYWVKYDGVIYSPTMGPGVDFNPTLPNSDLPNEHFDVLMAWGEAHSNPAREFVQMIGRVRKLKDRTVHLHLSYSPAREVSCTEASIRDEMNRCYDTLNSDNKLDPVMRQNVVDAQGQSVVRFHEPLYLEIYVQNCLEKARSRAMFTQLVLRDIQDHLNTEEGGRMEQVDPDWLDEATRREVNKERRHAREEQTEEACARIAFDAFASEQERIESSTRLQQQQGTERDKRLAKRQRIVHAYCLQRVPMVVTAVAKSSAHVSKDASEKVAMEEDEEEKAEQVSFASRTPVAHAAPIAWVPDWDALARGINAFVPGELSQLQPLPLPPPLPPPGSLLPFAIPQKQCPLYAGDLNEDAASSSAILLKFTEFLRAHGDVSAIDEFKLFCKANGPLHTLKLLLQRKIRHRPKELWMQHPEWAHFEDIRLLKGLLRAVGFVTQKLQREDGERAFHAAEDPVYMWEEVDEDDVEEEKGGDDMSDGDAPAVIPVGDHDAGPDRVFMQVEQELDAPDVSHPGAAPRDDAGAGGRGTSAAAAATVPQTFFWEDGGDLCCLESANTESVECSLSQADTCKWLDVNVPYIQRRFGCKLAAPYRVEDAVRALRAALKATIGLPLRATGKTSRVFLDGRSPSTLTSWSLVSLQRDSVLELAYAVWCSRPALFRVGCPLFVDWDVDATMKIHQPMFRWQMLTGVERPPDWPQNQLQAKEGEKHHSHPGTAPPKKTRTRKRKKQEREEARQEEKTEEEEVQVNVSEEHVAQEAGEGEDWLVFPDQRRQRVSAPSHHPAAASSSLRVGHIERPTGPKRLRRQDMASLLERLRRFERLDETTRSRIELDNQRNYNLAKH